MKHLHLIFIFLVLNVSSFSQSKEKEEVLAFQEQLNKEYSDSLTSPLTLKERLNFKSHDFYPIDLKYRVKAKLVKTIDEKPFKMATTKGIPRDYVKYGELYFKLNGKDFKLNVYQSLDLLKREEYKNYLFLAFRDHTSNHDTYGGGRFIDLTIPEGEYITLDFNKAYNPYCAYSDKYSCPITPTENFIETDVKAGVKGPVNH